MFFECFLALGKGVLLSEEQTARGRRASP
jgi:hypothetical protein